ncbi:MAG: HAD-IC family P-type ATPase, partial [Cetobacterium sp.]
MGSNVISGSSKGIVITTGDETILGRIAKDLNKKKNITSFEKGVNSVSKVLITFMFFMVPFIFLINGVVKGDWFEAFLFALSIAVGLTPEMLPMIVSANLAKGARKMAKKKVIVKNLNAIQDLGAMDILCTDKTGTLTEDKIVLEHYFNINEQEDKDVLKYAFLNSFYQTGLKNLIDIAIIKHANEKEIDLLTKTYTKIDEIPFDFNRRKMSVLVENIDKNIELVTKGAVEEIIEISSFIQKDGEIVSLTRELKEEIMQQVKKFNSFGLRILGIAKKELNRKSCSLTDENNMIFMGYLAFLDPPKSSTKEAIKSLLEFNVGVKILTGDNDS